MYVKVPYVFWTDASGNFTVSTVSGLEVSAYGKEVSKCIDQIKKFIAWKADQDTYDIQPDFHEPVLEFYTVSIRSGYLVEDIFYPNEKRLHLKVPVVWGLRDDGLVVCNLPTIHKTFHCRQPDLLESLVPSQVQAELDGKPPIELSRFFPPENIAVGSLNVRIRNKSNQRYSQSLATVETVASRLASRQHKSTFPQAWQQDNLVQQLIEKLEVPFGNVLLLGNSGVGKSTILVNAIRKMEKRFKESRSNSNRDGNKTAEIEQLYDAGVNVVDRYWFTSADRLIAGMQYLGQWEARLEQVIQELSSVQGVLCFNSLEQLIRLGGREPTESIACFLAPFLQNQELRMVVEANKQELDACRRLLPGFDSLFEIFEVEDFSQEQARAVLMAIGEQQKQNKKLEFDIATADLTFRLFKRFFPYDTFPGKCVQFWKKLFLEYQSRVPMRDRKADDSLSGISKSEIQVDKEGQAGNQPVDSQQKSGHHGHAAVDQKVGDGVSTDREATDRVSVDHVIEHFVELTGLPEALIRDEFVIPPSEIEEFFRSRIIGQSAACTAVTNIITTLKAGLNDPSRPIGVQLFCGPTGVGKTEMAKALAEYMFGSSLTDDRPHSRLVRLDMSEYSGYGAAERLMIQPNGEPSMIIQRIRQQPFMVLLLDEIEKAGSEVFDVLMSVFDEGRMTDRWGRTTDFRSTIIIMTSNLGVRKSSPIGFEHENADIYEQEVKNFFRPEFYNRFDSIVSFKPLGKASIHEITKLELQRITKRTGLQHRNLTLHWDDRLVDFLGTEGFDKRYGARPLQRVIESTVVAPVSRFLAEHPETRDRSIVLELVETESDKQVRIRI